MKKIVLITLAILSTGVLFVSSCKKGPEDPFFSMRSRKARVVGNWEATVYTINGVDQLSRQGIDTVKVGVTPAGCGWDFVTNDSTWHFIWSFAKDGTLGVTYDSVLTHTHLLDSALRVVVTPAEATTCVKAPWTEEGGRSEKYYWNFLGNIGGSKNKEQIYLYDPNNASGSNWEMIKCSASELKLEHTVKDQLTGISTVEHVELKPHK